MKKERIEYYFNHIYKAIKDPEKNNEESIKNTAKYYLIDALNSQREEDASLVYDAFNKWDKTEASKSGPDIIVDRIVHMIRNEIAFSLKEIGESYRSFITEVLK